MKKVEIDNIIGKFKNENIKMEGITELGEGAWHKVYRVERKNEDDLVLRVRKKIAYGEIQAFKDIDLITEYESAKAYYLQANQCMDSISPSFYEYYMDDSLVFNIESYMGGEKTFKSLELSEAFEVGEKIGNFLKIMHGKNPDLNGYGNLEWNGERLEGELQQEVSQIWQMDNDFYIRILNKLKDTNLSYNRDKVGNMILKLIEDRRKCPQKISLVNQDVTPENLIFNIDNLSIIDPYPRLDFDMKYAGFFVFCYNFLLPAYSNTDRYKKHSYNQYSNILTRIAEGFIEGYIEGNDYFYKNLLDEYILWILLEAYEHYEVLNEDVLNSKVRQQMGDEEMIKNRLALCLKELENAASDNAFPYLNYKME
ncbi:hypothetical protein D0S48_09020 [Psychrobacillus sp. AK 1817]|uniref:Aminoglycoside phosphotransferase domain-containing protein n=1 Tax=Psychrobacillus faecigallinarum TaxID=2762235 RepID=A0ABR8R6F1_9BACI|nr:MULTISPECIES: hypothetical protein [Psychrobacillus]MBD7943369.1 hypothetical protein [Psychrobacillus faecigallinarum]QEY20827.1 hypothetical protein D0S48_09020 [Psychrobacillus sp. AK 1817]